MMMEKEREVHKQMMERRREGETDRKGEDG